MGKVLMEVLVTILIAGIFLMLYSAIRISDIADRRVREIRSIETFDKQNQQITVVYKEEWLWQIKKRRLKAD